MFRTVFLALLVSCGGSRKASPTLEENPAWLIPEGAQFVWVAEPLKSAVTSARELVLAVDILVDRKLAQKELGNFKPFLNRSWMDVGIDLERPAYAWYQDKVTVILPIADQGKLERFLVGMLGEADKQEELSAFGRGYKRGEVHFAFWQNWLVVHRSGESDWDKKLLAQKEGMKGVGVSAARKFAGQLKQHGGKNYGLINVASLLKKECPKLDWFPRPVLFAASADGQGADGGFLIPFPKEMNQKIDAALVAPPKGWKALTKTYPLKAELGIDLKAVYELDQVFKQACGDSLGVPKEAEGTFRLAVTAIDKQNNDFRGAGLMTAQSLITQFKLGLGALGSVSEAKLGTHAGKVIQIEKGVSLGVIDIPPGAIAVASPPDVLAQLEAKDGKERGPLFLFQIRPGDVLGLAETLGEFGEDGKRAAQRLEAYDFGEVAIIRQKSGLLFKLSMGK